MPSEIKFELDWSGILDAMDRGAHAGAVFAGDLLARKAKEIAPERTGALRASIRSGEPTGSFVDGSLEVIVGAAAPYATFVEFGTGLYGPKKQRIRRANGGAFEIPDGAGGFIYRYVLDGMEAQPYITPAVEQNRENIATQIAAAIDLSLDDYGRTME